jgi:predicted Fe-S protein YdhL (DUF1289 family)
MALAAIAFDVSRLGLLTATKTPLAEASSVGTVAGDWAWLDSAEICVGVKGDHNRKSEWLSATTKAQAGVYGRIRSRAVRVRSLAGGSVGSTPVTRYSPGGTACPESFCCDQRSVNSMISPESSTRT